ncbi:MAG: hypothetical protein ACQEQL_02295 [Pseudomonadota bacterium]
MGDGPLAVIDAIAESPAPDVKATKPITAMSILMRGLGIYLTTVFLNIQFFLNLAVWLRLLPQKHELGNIFRNKNDRTYNHTGLNALILLKIQNLLSKEIFKGKINPFKLRISFFCKKTDSVTIEIISFSSNNKASAATLKAKS